MVAWADELRARAESARLGLPPPALPPRAPPGPPPPYLSDEESLVRAAALPPPVDDERWLFFASAGAAVDGGFQPGALSGHAGTAARAGASYQIGVGYRLSLRARLDFEVAVDGLLLPWARADAPGGNDVAFLTVIALGLRADIPLLERAGVRLLLSPSAAGGLGSVSADLDPNYQSTLALRFGLALAVERGPVGGFLEPESFLLLGGDVHGLQWTTGVTAGVRLRF